MLKNRSEFWATPTPKLTDSIWLNIILKNLEKLTNLTNKFNKDGKTNTYVRKLIKLKVISLEEKSNVNIKKGFN